MNMRREALERKTIKVEKKKVKSLKTTRDVCRGKWGGHQGERETEHPRSRCSPSCTRSLTSGTSPPVHQTSTVLGLPMRRPTFCDITDGLKVTHCLTAASLKPKPCPHSPAPFICTRYSLALAFAENLNIMDCCCRTPGYFNLWRRIMGFRWMPSFVDSFWNETLLYCSFTSR